MYIPGVYAQIHIHLFSLHRNIHIYLNYYPELTKDRFILHARVCVRSCSCVANAINNITKKMQALMANNFDDDYCMYFT